MAGTNIERIKEYLTEISKICKIDVAYLFGSFVHTDDMEKSDIDLALFSDMINEKNFIKYLSEFLIISARCNLNIEPHIFNSREIEENFVQQEIIQKGIRLPI